MKHLLLTALQTVVVGVLSLVVVTITKAEPAVGVTPNVIGRRVLGLHRWPIFLAAAGCQGDGLWDLSASAVGASGRSRTG